MVAHVKARDIKKKRKHGHEIEELFYIGCSFSRKKGVKPPERMLVLLWH